MRQTTGDATQIAANRIKPLMSATSAALRGVSVLVLVGACSPVSVHVEPAPPPSTAHAAVTPPTTTDFQPSSHSVAPGETAPSAAAVTTTSTAPAASASTGMATATTAPDLTWTLLAGGDVLMDRSEAAGVDPFTGIEPPLASADIALINLEMAISRQGTPADKKYVFRAPPSAAERIGAAGVDVANVANNHAMDYGGAALVDTVDLLEVEGVIALGAGATGDEAYRHRIIEVHPGVQAAFVGASMVVPLGFAATQTRPGIASAHQRDRVLANVRAAAAEADVVIATVHWGIERATCPNGLQRDFAFELLRNGADAVIGHHPHVLQPVVFEGGKLVAYSLGNFVWHYRSGITGDTGVLQIDFDGAEIVGWSFHPHLLDANGAPVPAAEGARVDRINDIISGDCARHQPPPTTAAPTPDLDTGTDGEAESEPGSESEGETESGTETEPSSEDETQSGDELGAEDAEPETGDQTGSE